MTDNDNGPRPWPCSALHLTKRQRQVLALIADGRTTRAIAETLGISPNTVEHHVKAMMAAARTRSRRGLAAIARSQGLLDMTASPPRWTGCKCPLDRQADGNERPPPVTPACTANPGQSSRITAIRPSRLREHREIHPVNIPRSAADPCLRRHAAACGQPEDDNSPAAASPAGGLYAACRPG